MSPDGLALIGPLGVEMIATAGWAVDSIGGLTLGADPIACAISYASASTAKPLRAFTVRKEPKSHGMVKLIEGPFQSGDRVVVVEDTITTGESARKATSCSLHQTESSQDCAGKSVPEMPRVSLFPCSSLSLIQSMKKKLSPSCERWAFQFLFHTRSFPNFASTNARPRSW